MSKNPAKILLTLILFLFLFTRLYKINEIPLSLYWDEASIGYNAYSILKTGRDEWGEFLPVHFRAFGEFKLPVYIYSVVLSESFFGLSEVAVRIPAILFSLISVLLTYSLGKKLSGEKSVGLFSAFLLTLSSWFFIFSRVGYEITAGLMFYLLGVFLMFNYYKSVIFSVLATICFILSLYSYNSFRVLVPITFIVMTFFVSGADKPFKKRLTYILISILLFSISLIPVFKVLIFDAGFGRVQSFAVFPTIKQVYDIEGNPRLQIIYDRSNDGNINIGERFLTLFKNYFIHLSPDFLLFKGDRNLRHQQFGFGQIYMLDLIFVSFGIFYIIKTRRKLLYIPLLLFILNLLPASLFKESPHGLRSLSVVPFICIISAFGIQYLHKIIKVSYFFVIFAYLLFFGNYFWHFINVYPVDSAHEYQYSYKQIYTRYSDQFVNYDQIVISNQYAQPYIFALFYLKIPTEEFRTLAKYASVEDWGFSTVEQIGKFKFTKINKESLPLKKSLIFVTPPEKLDNLKESDVIKNLDGSVGLYVYKI